MGTNYYAVKTQPSTERPIHIGKSSIGWLFNFEVQNDTWRDTSVKWNTYEQVREWLYEHTEVVKDYVIMNEYDEIVPFDQFIDLVQSKQNDPFCNSNPDNFTYARNVDGYRFSDEEFV